MKFEYANDVRRIATIVNLRFNLSLDLGKIEFLRSYGSRSKAIARTFMLPSQWKFVLKPNIIYIVEVISERFDKLPCKDKVLVVLHELNHIPTRMTGGLRNHTHPVFRRKVKEKVLEEICKEII